MLQHLMKNIKIMKITMSLLSFADFLFLMKSENMTSTMFTNKSM